MADIVKIKFFITDSFYKYKAKEKSLPRRQAGVANKLKKGWHSSFRKQSITFVTKSSSFEWNKKTGRANIMVWSKFHSSPFHQLFTHSLSHLQVPGLAIR